VTYSVGNSEVANYANTSTGKVTNVVADNGVGGSGESVNVVDRVALSFVVATNIQFLTVDVTSLANYVAGMTDVTVTVNAGVYVYGTNPVRTNPTSQPFTQAGKPIPSMQIIGGSAGDTVKLVNNGNIVGYGGDGGAVYLFEDACGSLNRFNIAAANGSAALSLVTPGISVTIENNGYIAGGGGGGGFADTYDGATYVGGGGGAGGGVSGGRNPVTLESLTRAVPPNAGSNGAIIQFDYSCNVAYYLGGGGGGFVLPGTGGTYVSSGSQNVGGGGGAGGSGSVNNEAGLLTFNNNGGSANNAAPTYARYLATSQGGGGGGWGAAGSSGYDELTLNNIGAAGGNSILTNGNAYTLTGSGTLYGSVNTAVTTAVYTFPTSSYATTQLNVATIPGFTSQFIDILLIVPANVVLTNSSTDSAGLRLYSTNSNFVNMRIVINGAILGKGGLGGSETSQGAGGDALYLDMPNMGQIIIDNTNGYVAGGGGGGGRGQNNTTVANSTIITYGGGGAGYFGSSGDFGQGAYNPGISSGVSVGNNGSVVVNGAVTYASGGSGGTILPGVRTRFQGSYANQIVPGLGGSAGGTGAFSVTQNTVSFSDFSSGNSGGAYKGNGGNLSMSGGTTPCAGGGGGGWGATGGIGRRSSTTVQNGRLAGKAIRLNNSSTQIYVLNPTNLAGIIAFA